MFRWTVDQLIEAITGKGWLVFDAHQKGGYDLNLFGVRAVNQKAGSFDDWIGCFYRDAAGVWVLFAFPGTTDPGDTALVRPINGAGTAILPTGQHRGLWQLGKHQGKYDALVQAKPVGVYRDNDRDKQLEMDGTLDVGMHGINLHRANPDRRSTVVGMWSAGCQVIADPVHFDCLIELARQQVHTLRYNTFSYTLIDERDLP